jgi:hypothetical protein
VVDCHTGLAHNHVHGLKSLLPHGVCLIPYRKECDGHHGCSGEAALTQGGECDERRLLDSDVGLATDDGPRPRLCWVERYGHAGLAYVQAVDRGQAAAVDHKFPAIAKANECVIEHSWKPQAMLAYGTQSPILGEEKVGVAIHVHLKSQP